jgi:iron-sulfur cluster insertion protein
MSISVTSRAAEHLLKHGGVLRIRVKSGGCSGLKILFDLGKEVNPGEKDLLFMPQEGIQIVVDPLSLNFIAGSTVEYREEMLASQLSLVNPKSTNACGCGDSFSVA